MGADAKLCLHAVPIRAFVHVSDYSVCPVGFPELVWYGIQLELQLHFVRYLAMDATRAVAITSFPTQRDADVYKKLYERFSDELDVLPDTATATAAIEDLVRGK